MATDPFAVFGRFDTTGPGGGVDPGRFGAVNPLLFPHDYAYPSPADGDDTYDSPQEQADRLGAVLSSRYGLSVDPSLGNGVADAHSAIQAQLDAGPGLVSLPPGLTFAVSSTLVVPSNVTLDLNRSTIVPLGDFSVIDLRQNATLCGGLINCASVGAYSSAAVTLFGTTTFGSPQVLTLIKDLRIEGVVGVGAGGTGILFDTGTAASNRVSFVNVTDVHVDGFEYGVRMLARTPASGSVWIVGSTWNGLQISRSRRFIDFTSQSSQQIAGHNFFGTQVQTNAAATSGLTASGMVFRVNFEALTVYDWQLVAPSIEFGADTFWNRVVTDEPRSRVLDAGNANSFVCRTEAPAVTRTALYLPATSGEFVSTPDDASLDITDNLDIALHVAMDDWTPSASPNLLAKRQTAGQFSWQFALNTSGTLRLLGSANGTVTGDANSSVAPTVTDGAFLWVRATFEAGQVKFYTTDDQGDVPSASAWTQLGTTRTMTSSITSLFSSTSQIEVGSVLAGTAGNLGGSIRRAIIRNGIGGTVVADFRADYPFGSRYRDSTGKVWTTNGTTWAYRVP